MASAGALAEPADPLPPPTVEVPVGGAEDYPVGVVRLVLAAGRRIHSSKEPSRDDRC